MKRWGLIIAVGATLALALLPWAGKGYHLLLLTVVFHWVALAGCWNLMSGMSGSIDFGAVAYFGVGAYVAGLLMIDAGWPLAAALGAAGVGAALLSILVGWPTLRLRGAYFAIATFALAEALRQVCLEWSSVTHGGMGITLPMHLEPLDYYWAYLALAAGVTGLAWWISGHRLGYALNAIRQDEEVAARVGINTHMAKMSVHVAACFFLGLLGALEATRLGYMTPNDAFNVHVTIKMVVMSLLGGIGTVLGPVVGATFLQVMEDLLGAQFLNAYLVILGGIIVALIMFLPRGIMGSAQGLGRRGR